MHISASFPARAAIKYLSVATAVLIFAGCVTVNSVVPATEVPKAMTGYVAGAFSSSGADYYGLGITPIKGGDEIVLPFTDPAYTNAKSSLERVTMIELPSGRYRISSWGTFSRLKEAISRKELTAGVEELEFDVAPGRVRYLGKFSGATSAAMSRVNFRIEPQRIAQKDLALLFEVNYPNFAMDLVDAQAGSVY